MRGDPNALSRLCVALTLSSMRAATIPCYRAGSFDPYKSLTFLPNASREPTAATDGRAGQASAAWRELAEGAGRRCLFDCRASIGGNRNGYGSYLNSVLGSVRSVMKDLGALPAPDIRLPRSLEPARRPPDDARFAGAACAAGSLACFFRPFNGANGSAPCASLRDCDAARPRARGAPRVSELLRAGSPFWNVAEATRRLLQPARALAARLAAERAALGLGAAHVRRDDALAAPRPRLAMHIRRGDACNHDAARTGRTCGPVRAYADAAAELAARYGFRSLVVASDSDGALAELRALLPASGWPADAPVRARNDSTLSDAVRQRMTHIEHAWRAGGEIEPWHEFYSFAADVQLLAECDGLVGKFTSNMDRIVYALMAGRARCHRPYISLDAPFCFGGFGYSLDSELRRDAKTGLGMFPCHVDMGDP